MLPTDRITEILDNFLLPFGTACAFSDDFVYDTDNKMIYYGLLVQEDADRYFMDFIHSLAPEITIDVFLMSVLHELGHHMTLDQITDEVYEQCFRDKLFLSEMADNPYSSFTMEHIHKEYFNIPVERVATEWAIDYIRGHVEELKALWSELQAAILDFYNSL